MGLIVLPQKHCLDCVSKIAREVVVAADHSTHVVYSMAEYL